MGKPFQVGIALNIDLDQALFRVEIAKGG